MRTEIQALIDRIKGSINDLSNLAGYSHTADDVSIHVKVVGAALERFLKDAVYNNLSMRDSLNELITRLKRYDVEVQTLDAFHELRGLYNKTKHNAAFLATIDETVTTLNKVVLGLNDMQVKNVSAVNRPYRMGHSRILWVSAWDHYTSGETEISILLPQKNAIAPPAIEHFNIHFSGWDVVKEKYTSTDELLLGKEYLPEEIYTFWNQQSDFLAAGVFKGDVRELVTDLAKHIDSRIENKLMPMLKRENDLRSLKCALTFSLKDALNENHWTNREDLQEELCIRAAYDYGINLCSKYLKDAVDSIPTSIDACDRGAFKVIDEILWMNRLSFSKQQIKCSLSPRYLIIVNADNKMVCCIE